MKMMTVTPRCTSDRFSSVPSTRYAQVRALRPTTDERSSSKAEGELPAKPTAAGIALRIPAVDLWTTRQSMQPSAKKCYPCYRIKLLPMLPVDQGEGPYQSCAAYPDQRMTLSFFHSVSSRPKKTLRFRLLAPQSSRAFARSGWLIHESQL